MQQSVRSLIVRSLVASLVLLAENFSSGPAAHAQEEPAADSQALAKQLSNPIASLISVPFQANWDFDAGPEEDTRFILNFQPVMPFSANAKWNLIQRVIVPFLAQPALVPGGEATSGLGDILASSFFSPKESRVAIWGVGPALQLPVSSEPTLGSEKWAAGPTFVVLKQSGPWTYGALANHLWSYAGDDERADIDQTFVQPFLAYATPSAVTYSLNSEAAANWEAADGVETWTVPVNLFVSKVLRLGRRPISVGLGAGYFVEKPDGGPDWKLRTNLTLLFPTGPPPGG